MKPNTLNSQRKPFVGDFTLADNLARHVPAGELIQRTLEAVQTFLWNTKTGTRTPVLAGRFNPRVLLTLLTYSYATGIFASASITGQSRRDATLRYLSLGVEFAPDRIRVFRGQNSELLKRCLTFVIRHVWDRCQSSTRAAQGPDGLVTRNNAKDCAAHWTLVLSQREAERRFNHAVELDRADGAFPFAEAQHARPEALPLA